MDRLWLDAHDYGARLLRGGNEPWSTPATLGPFYGELAALLRPFRLLVPLGPLLRACQGADAEPAVALERAAQSHAFARSLETGLATLAHGACAGLLAPMLPGPTVLGCDPDDEDALDDSVAALGQVLRALLATPLSGTILVEEPDAEARDAMGPLRRIAEHGGVALRVVGQGIDTLSWDKIDGLTGDRDTLVTIPGGAEPEAVLARLEALRTTARGT